MQKRGTLVRPKHRTNDNIIFLRAERIGPSKNGMELLLADNYRTLLGRSRINNHRKALKAKPGMRAISFIYLHILASQEGPIRG